MTRQTIVLTWLMAFIGIAIDAEAQTQTNSAPVVTITQVSLPPEYPKQVLINYNLVDADGDSCTVWVNVSDNGGSSWRVPARTFVGDVTRPGQSLDIAPADNKWIRWDAGADIPGAVGNFRFRVWAEDGKGLAEMVVVEGGPFPYQNTTPWVSLPTFLIDKYEVTNEQYCQFLNNRQFGDNDDHWDANQEISRSSTQPYFYTVALARELYPIRYVSYTDAEHFAAWRSQREGVTYRLPTEQQWQKAAAWDPTGNNGAGKSWTYGFRFDVISCNWCVFSGESCGYDGPRIVGYFRGSEGRNDAKSYYGCYDMSGNVSEWTSSLYTDSSAFHVVKGGSWGSTTHVACYYRGSYDPSVRYLEFGFRLVLDTAAN